MSTKPSLSMTRNYCKSEGKSAMVDKMDSSTAENLEFVIPGVSGQCSVQNGSRVDEFQILQKQIRLVLLTLWYVLHLPLLKWLWLIFIKVVSVAVASECTSWAVNQPNLTRVDSAC